MLEKHSLPCHCLLIEAGDKLVLVDTGFGTGDIADPGRLGQPLRALIAPVLREEETAVRQIEGLGLDPGDVRQIAITHLDLDHAGGLGDFPAAEVHVFEDELNAALNPTVRERSRYIQKHWAHGPDWESHTVDGDDWLGFEAVRVMPGLDAEVVMVPLVGHTAGHVGIAVKEGGRWLLHCGDAFFFHGEIATPPRDTVGWRAYAELTSADRGARARNVERLRELAAEHSSEVTLICSHDPEMLRAYGAD